MSFSMVRRTPCWAQIFTYSLKFSLMLLRSLASRITVVPIMMRGMPMASQASAALRTAVRPFSASRLSGSKWS